MHIRQAAKEDCGYREIETHSLLTENGDYLCYDVMEKITIFSRQSVLKSLLPTF